MKKKVIVSFSGGKDSMLALHTAIDLGYEPAMLVTTVNTNNGDSWFHDISKEYLISVSKSINVPIHFIYTDGNDYEEVFLNNLKDLNKDNDIFGCVFGDIDIDHHRKWGEDLCIKAGVASIFPLWQKDRKTLVNTFIDLGYKAIIKKVNTNILSSSFLGKTLSKDLILDIEKAGSDACGENGEYHTFVYNGPLFKEDIPLKIKEVSENDSVLSFIS